MEKVSPVFFFHIVMMEQNFIVLTRLFQFPFKLNEISSCIQKFDGSLVRWEEGPGDGPLYPATVVCPQTE